MTACPHPAEALDEAISHLGDPDWAYCFDCACLVRKADGEWVAQPRPRTTGSREADRG